MSEKKFSGVQGIVEDPNVTSDFNTAAVFDNLRVGKLGVYFRSGLRMRYIPFTYMDRAFIRIHEVNGKLCCGSTVFHYFRLVFVHDDKEFADSISENETAMNDALKEIARNAPDVSIGFHEKETN